jgi:hypothetical protein
MNRLERRAAASKRYYPQNGNTAHIGLGRATAFEKRGDTVIARHPVRESLARSSS